MALRFDRGTYYLDELAAIRNVQNARDEGAHTHDFVELVYILRGKTIQRIDEVEYPAGHGDMLLINNSQRHSMVCQPGTEYINILMKPEAISESMAQAGNAFSLLMLKDFSEFQDTVNRSHRCVHFEGSERVRLEMLLHWLLQEHREARGGGALMMRSGLNMLLIQLFRKMALPMYLESSGINEGLLSYIRENCARRITLEGLAEDCGYAPSYFSRLFKRYTGRPLTKYILDCRMEMACSLLENTQQSVDSVILECGFSDRTKFFRQFSKHTGMTPLKYRKSKN